MRKLNVQDVIETLGKDAITSLGEKIDNRYLKEGGLEKYIQEKLSVAHYLNLDTASKKVLLDIGTGAGWFPYICKLYGHDCIGTDILGRKEYDAVYKFLNIDIVGNLVYSQTPLNLQRKFDYIVSLRSFFPNRPKVWELEDWKYFFKDIQKYVNNNGGVYLGCNSGKRGKYKNTDQPSHWGPVELDKIFNPYIVTPNKELKIKPYTIYIDKKSIIKIEELL